MLRFVILFIFGLSPELQSGKKQSVAKKVVPPSKTVVAADEYSLDTLERVIPPKGRMRCPQIPMVTHKGGSVRYHKPVLVYKDFKPHLERFEAIVSELATEVYGRAPAKIRHVGTYNCRRIRRFPDLLSEHGLGNAIDIAGFDFAPAKTQTQRSASPHPSLRRRFQIRLDEHWDKEHGTKAIHAEFLRSLTERLIEDDVFRVMLGPSYPGHKDHFHFDLAPYRLIDL
jgi:hypothetical protein